MRRYSFLDTIVLVNGIEIIEWDEGDDVIEIERAVDSVSHKIGAGGNMMISISANKSGSAKFKLQQTSPSNAYLNGLMSLIEDVDQFVPVQFTFQDMYRHDLAQGTLGYIKKPAGWKRGEKGTNNEWEIVVERLDLVLGNPIDIIPQLI